MNHSRWVQLLLYIAQRDLKFKKSQVALSKGLVGLDREK